MQKKTDSRRNRKTAILLVENNKEARELYENILKVVPGIEVFSSKGLIPAAEIIKSSSIDVLVSNISLNGDNALPLIGKLINKNPDAKMLFITGQDKGLEQISQFIAEENIMKTPLDVDKFIKKIASITNKIKLQMVNKTLRHFRSITKMPGSINDSFVKKIISFIEHFMYIDSYSFLLRCPNGNNLVFSTRHPAHNKCWKCPALKQAFEERKILFTDSDNILKNCLLDYKFNEESYAMAVPFFVNHTFLGGLILYRSKKYYKFNSYEKQIIKILENIISNILFNNIILFQTQHELKEKKKDHIQVLSLLREERKNQRLFINMIGHELRNALTPVIGLCGTYAFTRYG